MLKYALGFDPHSRRFRGFISASRGSFTKLAKNSRETCFVVSRESCRNALETLLAATENFCAQREISGKTELKIPQPCFRQMQTDEGGNHLKYSHRSILQAGDSRPISCFINDTRHISRDTDGFIIEAYTGWFSGTGPERWFQAELIRSTAPEGK